MIQIIPSITVKNGKVAILKNDHSGEYTFLKDSPLDQALKFEDLGLKKVQLIDLDGVETDTVKNLNALSDISRFTGLEVEFGGGVNTDDEIRLAFEYGASQVACSTLLSMQKELFGAWIITYGRNKLILSVDTFDDKVNVYGDTRHEHQEDVLDYIDYFYHFGILYVKCTDLNMVHKGEGPRFDLYNKIKNRFPDLKLIASGGIRGVEDITRLQEQNIYGAVFSSAWYDGRINANDLKKFTI